MLRRDYSLGEVDSGPNLVVGTLINKRNRYINEEGLRRRSDTSLTIKIL